MKTLLTKLAVVGSLLTLAAFQAVAQAPGGGGGRGPGGGMMLTQDQFSKLREAGQASQSEMTQLNEKLAAAQKEAIKAALAKDADEKTVRPKVEAVAKIQTDIAMLRLKAVKEISSTITDEQKTQMDARPQMAYPILLGGFGGFGGFGGGRGPGGGGGGGRGPGGGGGGNK